MNSKHKKEHAALRRKLGAAAAALALCVCVSAPARAETIIAAEHSVGSGECFSTIAQRYRVSFEELIAANPQFPDHARIWPGQIVHIPATGPVRAAEETAAAIVNSIRLRSGLEPLEETSALCRAAKSKCGDMRDRGYYDRVSPLGQGPEDFAAAQGAQFDTVAECLAWGYDDPWALVTACMDSPSRREALLDPSLRHMGIGWLPGWNLWTVLLTE